VAGFDVPPDLLARARKFGRLLSPKYPKTMDDLLTRLLEKTWRGYPMLFDLPSHSQFFGQLVLAAGIGGIVYPSTRVDDAKVCIAIFPGNFAGSTSALAVDDPLPPGASHTKLTCDTYREFLVP
jgi:hypothetical protein